MEYLYNVCDIAAILEVHPETVRRWIRKGELKTLGGGSIRWRKFGYVISAEQAGSFIVNHPIYYKRFLKLWENTIAALKILSPSERSFKENNALIISQKMHSSI